MAIILEKSGINYVYNQAIDNENNYRFDFILPEENIIIEID